MLDPQKPTQIALQMGCIWISYQLHGTHCKSAFIADVTVQNYQACVQSRPILRGIVIAYPI